MFWAPEDFPNSLPKEPLNYEANQRLVEEWQNVTRINDVNWEMMEGEKVCINMIFHTEDGRGFGVNWQDGGWNVLERYDMAEGNLEIPCAEDKLNQFIDSITCDEDEYYVYVLACELPDEKTAEKRAKELYPPKTKREVRDWFLENNRENWNDFSEGKKSKILDRESGFSAPSWFYNALNAESIYYVGFTDDVNRRIEKHIEGIEVNGAYFTEVFPPTHLVEVYGFETMEEAREGESEVGSEILDYPNVVAYWF